MGHVAAGRPVGPHVADHPAPPIYWGAIGFPRAGGVVVTSYDELGEVYEWLISDAKLGPVEFAASFADVLDLLPSLLTPAR